MARGYGVSLKDRGMSKEIKEEATARGCGSREGYPKGREREMAKRRSGVRKGEPGTGGRARETDGAEKRSLPTAPGDARKHAGRVAPFRLLFFLLLLRRRCAPAAFFLVLLFLRPY